MNRENMKDTAKWKTKQQRFEAGEAHDDEWIYWAVRCDRKRYLKHFYLLLSLSPSVFFQVSMFLVLFYNWGWWKWSEEDSWDGEWRWKMLQFSRKWMVIDIWYWNGTNWLQMQEHVQLSHCFMLVFWGNISN